jgi:hypothetical protein
MINKGNQFIKIAIFNNTVQADILRSLLDAQNIRVLTSKEAVGVVGGVFAGPVSDIELYVPSDQETQARAIVHKYFEGAEPDV